MDGSSREGSFKSSRFHNPNPSFVVRYLQTLAVQVECVKARLQTVESSSASESSYQKIWDLTICEQYGLNDRLILLQRSMRLRYGRWFNWSNAPLLVLIRLIAEFQRRRSIWYSWSSRLMAWSKGLLDLQTQYIKSKTSLDYHQYAQDPTRMCRVQIGRYLHQAQREWLIYFLLLWEHLLFLFVAMPGTSYH